MTQSQVRQLIPWDGFDANYPGKIAPACHRIAEMLSDSGWHLWSSITAALAEEFDLQPKTTCNLLHGMVKTGGIERRGTWSRQKDGREARLAEPAVAK
jgi:hypothetical protein